MHDKTNKQKYHGGILSKIISLILVKLPLLAIHDWKSVTLLKLKSYSNVLKFDTKKCRLLYEAIYIVKPSVWTYKYGA